MSKSPVSISLSREFRSHHFKKEIIYLCKKDKDLIPLFVNYKNFKGFSRPKNFPGLARLIIEQQLSVASANAIFFKLKNTLGRFSATNILKTNRTQLKKCGLSRQKILYLKTLAEKCTNGDLSFTFVNKLSDEKIMEELIKIKGIGPWTAECYMLACLKRSDIWPVKDLGLQEAVKRLKKLKIRPNENEMEEISSSWKPYRSTVANVLWAYYD